MRICYSLKCFSEAGKDVSKNVFLKKKQLLCIVSCDLTDRKSYDRPHEAVLFSLDSVDGAQYEESMREHP